VIKTFREKEKTRSRDATSSDGKLHQKGLNTASGARIYETVPRGAGSTTQIGIGRTKRWGFKRDGELDIVKGGQRGPFEVGKLGNADSDGQEQKLKWTVEVMGTSRIPAFCEPPGRCRIREGTGYLER